MTKQIVAKIVSEFIDVMNEFGPDSVKAREFLAHHSTNQEILSLLYTARDVKRAIDEAGVK